MDHIVQTDVRPKGFVTDAERTFTAATRYPYIPIRNGAPKRVVTLLVDGQRVVRNDIELADATPDWWAQMDVSAWRGKSVTLRVDKLHEDSVPAPDNPPRPGADSFSGSKAGDERDVSGVKVC